MTRGDRRALAALLVALLVDIALSCWRLIEMRVTRAELVDQHVGAEHDRARFGRETIT